MTSFIGCINLSVKKKATVAMRCQHKPSASMYVIHAEIPRCFMKSTWAKLEILYLLMKFATAILILTCLIFANVCNSLRNNNNSCLKIEGTTLCVEGK